MADDLLAPDGVAQLAARLAAVILAETPSQLMRCARVVSKKAGDPTPAETAIDFHNQWALGHA